MSNSQPAPVWRAILLAGVATLSLAACTERAERVYFDGNYYPTRESHVDRSDREVFETRVRRATQGIEGAVAAGMHGGTRYCVTNFGTSDIDWLTPTDPSALDATQATLTMRGRCVTW